MIVKELIEQLQEAHDLDDLVCIYNQETGERVDILIVDDTIDGEVQLNIGETDELLALSN